MATRNEGVAALVDKLEGHRAWLFGTEAGAARREERLREAMHVQLRDALTDAAVAALGPALEAAVHAVAQRKVDPLHGVGAARRGLPQRRWRHHARRRRRARRRDLSRLRTRPGGRLRSGARCY